MADPLSTAASIIAVASLAGNVAAGIIRLHELYSKVKDAPKELRMLLARLEVTGNQLQDFHKLLVGRNDDSGSATEALQLCASELEGLSKIVKELLSDVDQGRWEKVKKSTRALLKEEKIEKLEKRLYNAQFSLSLSAQRLISQDIQTVRHELESLNQKQSKVLEAVTLREYRAVKSDEILLDFRREIKPKQQLDNLENLQSVLPSALKPVIEEMLAKTVLPFVENSLSRESLGNREQFPAEHCNRQMEPMMSVKAGDYVSSPQPSYSKAEPGRDELEQLSRPVLRRRTMERCDGAYSTLLAKIHYRSRLVRIEAVNDEDDSCDKTESNWNVRHEIESSFTIVPSWWLWGKGVGVSFVRTGQGWLPGINFSLFNLRADDALIFEFCATNNTQGVKSLLKRGEASPFDTDSEGWTPLHCAAQARNFELCKLLILEGANANAVDLRNISPLHIALSQDPASLPFLSSSPHATQTDSEATDVVRLLVEAGRSDPAIETYNGENCYDLLASTEKAQPGLFIWLLRKTTFQYDPHHRDADGCTATMKLCSMPGATCADIDKLVYLGADVNAKIELPEDYAGTYESGWTALHIATLQLASFKRKSQSSFLAHKERTRHLLRIKADVHALSTRGETPTDITMRYLSRRAFDIWHEILLDAGYDSREFVKKEIAIHAHVPWFVMNWCEINLMALFGVHEEPDDILSEIELSDLFTARDETPTFTEKFYSHRGYYENSDDSNDPGDMFGDDIEPILNPRPRTVAERREERRANWRRQRLNRERDPYITQDGNFSHLLWNGSNERYDWILYGRLGS